MLNIVALMGRLTSDPELKTTPNGISVCSFSIAVNRTFAKAGEERQADFINIVTWRNTAEFVSKYFTKGQLIGVDGSIQTRNYEDKNGNKRVAFEIVANNVHFAESKNSTNNRQNETPFNPPSDVMSFKTAENDDFIEITSDDDLPF
ncbi:MAG: single-stranded DNA-binding protein [Oscillospiraceae bacterium]